MRWLKELRNDHQGSESLFRPFVTLFVFVALTGFIVAASRHIYISNQMSQDYPEGWEMLGETNYTFWQPDEGADCLNGTIYDELPVHRHGLLGTYYRDNATCIFYPQGGSDSDKNAILMWVVRGQTPFVSHHRSAAIRDAAGMTDYFLFGKKTGRVFDDEKYRYTVIPIDTILRQSQDSTNNRTYTNFIIGKNNFTMIIDSPDWGTGAGHDFGFYYRIWYQNNYTMYLAVPVLDTWENMAHYSVWNVLGQVLTGTLPDTPELVNRIIFICTWAGIIFIAFTLISRFIPLIPGG